MSTAVSLDKVRAMVAASKKRQLENDAKKDARSTDFAKLPDGSSRWRIMGNWSDDTDEFMLPYGRHFVRNPEDGKYIVAACSWAISNTPCPICKQVREAEAAADEIGDQATKKALGMVKAPRRVLVNAMRIDTPAGEEQHSVILELPYSLAEMIQNQIEAYAEEGIVLLGSEGHDVIITKSGKGLDTKYSLIPAAKSSGTIPSEKIQMKNLGAIAAAGLLDASGKAALALTSVRAVAGFSAPAPSAHKSDAIRMAADADVWDADVPDFPTQKAAAPAPAPAPAPKPTPVPAPKEAPVREESADDEIDALIASLRTSE